MVPAPSEDRGQVPADKDLAYASAVTQWAWWRVTAAACLTMAAVTACQSMSATSGVGQRWSLLPHTFGCQAAAGDFPDGPYGALIKDMSVSHVGAEKVQLDVRFMGPPPPAQPQVIQTRFGTIQAPGTIDMSYLIHPIGLPAERVIAISSLWPSAGWHGDISEFDNTNSNVVESMSDSGGVRSFVLDLARIERQLGSSPLRVDVAVVVMVSGRPDATGAPNLFPVRGQDCNWDIAPLPVGTSRDPDPPPNVVAAPTPPFMPPLSTPPIPVSGADTQGFIDAPSARCDNQDRAAMVMRTPDSLVVVCRADEASLYYKGMRLSDSAAIRLDGATSTPGGYTVTNPTDGTRYVLSSQGLEVIIDGQQVSAESASQYAFL